MRTLREDMDNCFGQVDKRFEKMQVETAKHFDQLTSCMDHFIIWSFATTLIVGGIVIVSEGL